METCARQIASIALDEGAWVSFVRSGQILLVEESLLRQAQRDLERRLCVDKGPKGSRRRRIRGAARIRGYIIGHRQPC